MIPTSRNTICCLDSHIAPHRSAPHSNCIVVCRSSRFVDCKSTAVRKEAASQVTAAVCLETVDYETTTTTIMTMTSNQQDGGGHLRTRIAAANEQTTRRIEVDPTTRTHTRYLARSRSWIIAIMTSVAIIVSLAITPQASCVAAIKQKRRDRVVCARRRASQLVATCDKLRVADAQRRRRQCTQSEDARVRANATR